MESHAPPASSAATTVTPRKMSKTVGMTYVALGLFTIILLMASFSNLYQALVSGFPWLFIRGAILFNLSFGLIYVMWALHQRRNWARQAAVVFWLLCLIWTAMTIVRNGPHPAPPVGRDHYSNEEQLAGARFGTLVTPYFMAILESAALYCLLRRARLVNQFKSPSEDQ